MATIQLGRTTTANKLMSYAEKRAEVREGIDCPVEYAKAQMRATRELWGKNEGIQAHHVIQSFKPREVTPEIANQVGQDLARVIAKGHECVVYTHTDKDHIHNHIIINAVNYETGKKYQLHGKQAIERVREESDRLCASRSLSVVREESASVRYKLAEKSLLEKALGSWKDELREIIDVERKKVTSFEEFQQNLKEKYGVEVVERGKHITFTHPNGQKVRGNKLGKDYEKEELLYEFERQAQRSQERGRGSGVKAVTGANDSAQRFDEKLYQYPHGSTNDKPSNDEQRIDGHQTNKPEGTSRHDFDLDQATRRAEELRRNTTRDYGKWKDGNQSEQSEDVEKNERNRGYAQQKNERIRKQNIKLDR